MTTSQCSIRCEDKSGYSLFPVRIGALPTDAAFAPQGASQCKDAPAPIVGKYQAQLGPKPTQSRYALRILRKGGYLYVYCKGKPKAEQWQAYYTSDQGALIPIKGNSGHGAPFSCSQSAGHPHNVRTVCIADPDKAGETWLGFSANYWDEAFRTKVVEGDPAKLGMVNLDLKAPPAPALGWLPATAENISAYVADFSASNVNADNMVATSPLWDEGTRGPQDTHEHASRMATVMQKQAAASAASKGKTAIVALPDVIGLAVDLNAHRQLYYVWQQQVLSKKHAWEIKTDSILNSFESSVKDNPSRVQQFLRKVEQHAIATAGTPYSNIVSLQQWLSDDEHGYNRGRLWQAVPPIPNNSTVNPGFVLPQRAIDQEKEKAQSEWEKLQKLLDVDKRRKFKDEFAEETGKALKRTALYEGDWLALLEAAALHVVFSKHWDATAPNSSRAALAVNHGELYQQSAHAVYTPQALSSPQMAHRFLEATLGQNPDKDSAVYLRALCANQKTLWDYGGEAHDFLVGDVLRENSNPKQADNARDKTYDIVKGLVTVSGQAKYRWLTAASAGFSLGLITAAAAGVSSLVISPTKQFDEHVAQRWAPRLIRIQWLQQLYAKATEIAINMPVMRASANAQKVVGQASMTVAHMIGLIPLPQLVFRTMSAQDALKVKGIRLMTTRAEGKVMRRITDMQVSVAQIVMTAPMPGKGKEKIALSVQETYSNALEVSGGKLDAMREVAKAKAPDVPARSVAHGGAELVHELPLERNLARGAILVQGIGLFAARNNIAKWLDGQDVVLKDKLGIVDSASGFATGLLELYQVARKATLVASLGGAVGTITTAKDASLRLWAAASGAQLLGVAAGLSNVGIADISRREAGERGNREAARAYAFAEGAFALGTSVQAVFATNVITRGAINRLIQSLLFRGVGLVITEAGISTAWSGIGLVLLIGGTLLLFMGSKSERTALEQWISKSKFGNSDAPYRTVDQESEALEAALKEAEAQAAKANAEPEVAPPASAAGAPVAY